MNHRKAFTLIELLIVVAIIAILAAIAVPNFLEAQTRAKVSRAQADMRSLATAIEAYRVDNNGYPLAIVDAPIAPAYNPSNLIFSVFSRLSTPIAYITSYPDDAFEGQYDSTSVSDPLGVQKKYDYRRTRFDIVSGQTTIVGAATGLGIGVGETFDSWLLYSPGPDKEQNINTKQAYKGTTTVAGFGDPLADWPIYDPTNGTISVGDIVRSRDGDGSTLVGR